MKIARNSSSSLDSVPVFLFLSYFQWKAPIRKCCWQIKYSYSFYSIRSLHLNCFQSVTSVALNTLNTILIWLVLIQSIDIELSGRCCGEWELLSGLFRWGKSMNYAEDSPVWPQLRQIILIRMRNLRRCVEEIGRFFCCCCSHLINVIAKQFYTFSINPTNMLQQQHIYDR